VTGTEEFVKGNPTLTFVNVLETAAAKKEQSVAVTKDVMKVKKLFNDEAFKDKLLYVVNIQLTKLEEADEMLKLFGDLDSEVFPKFVVYLAKKNRLHQLNLICKEYVAGLYRSQSILPVLVTSAVKLTTDQKKTLKDKLKEKTGAADIKLVTQTDGNLLAGFTAEWGFCDPETLSTPTEGVDLSLVTYLGKAKLRGV
jgi:ATP synthase F1 delta subunit